METVGFSLSVLVQVQTVLKSLKERIACFKQEEDLVTEAHNSLSRVCTCQEDHRCRRGEAEGYHGSAPAEFPICQEVSYLCGKETAEAGPEVFPEEKKWQCRRRYQSEKAKQFGKAKSITKALQDILGTANRAEGTLQLQLTQLCGAVTTDAMEEKIRRIVEQNSSPAESFRPAFNASAVVGKVRLDYESMDEGGKFSIPEAKLRNCAFASTDTKNVTVARGKASCVHGVSGMAGVGKTTALIGLGHDQKIKAHFVHGVLYMSLGAAATEESVANELSKILERT